MATAKKKKGEEPEASTDDLRVYFEARDEEVPVNLDDVLSGLVKEKVLAEKQYPDTGSKYRVSW